MSDSRKFSRVPFIATSEIEMDGIRVKAEVIDLSLKGALLKLENPDQALRDDLILKVDLSEKLRLSFFAQVVHRQDFLVGIKFLAEDLDSFTHLRRVCELNAHDPDKITDELEFLAD